ncbi:MAG: SAM-dependent methyltransferase [Bacteroidetes bacterium]|nr:SAM-dependent methyltransferase [Bacteroidota bacterium]
MTGKIYLLPTYLDMEHLETIPEETKKITLSLKHIIVENIRTTRRYLKSLDRSVDIDAIHFFEWNKRHPKRDVPDFIKPALEGHDVGIISEAGCPGIADPGQYVVAAAHRKGLQVIPLSGPSSIFMALMASGLNGQQFKFNGYLPSDEEKKRKLLRHLEREATQRKETQIFMETPYKNNPMIKTLVSVLDGTTRLCLAANISSENEQIKTKTIAEWKKELPDLHKQPCIYLIL